MVSDPSLLTVAAATVEAPMVAAPRYGVTAVRSFWSIRLIATRGSVWPVVVSSAVPVKVSVVNSNRPLLSTSTSAGHDATGLASSTPLRTTMPIGWPVALIANSSAFTPATAPVLFAIDEIVSSAGLTSLSPASTAPNRTFGSVRSTFMT